MSPSLIVFILALYFGLLVTVSFLTSKSKGNDGFFVGDRQSPWYLVAFGMIGTSLSGGYIFISPWLGWKRKQSIQLYASCIGLFHRISHHHLRSYAHLL